MLKPDWKTAPSWARYAAMEPDGTWMWYAEKPTAHRHCWAASTPNFESFNPRPVHWTQTLTERPTE